MQCVLLKVKLLDKHCRILTYFEKPLFEIVFCHFVREITVSKPETDKFSIILFVVKPMITILSLREFNNDHGFIFITGVYFYHRGMGYKNMNYILSGNLLLPVFLNITASCGIIFQSVIAGLQ